MIDVDLCQFARHAWFGDVRDEGGEEGGGDADEEKRVETRGVSLRLHVHVVETADSASGSAE